MASGEVEKQNGAPDPHALLACGRHTLRPSILSSAFPSVSAPVAVCPCDHVPPWPCGGMDLPAREGATAQVLLGENLSSSDSKAASAHCPLQNQTRLASSRSSRPQTQGLSACEVVGL